MTVTTTTIEPRISRARQCCQATLAFIVRHPSVDLLAAMGLYLAIAIPLAIDNREAIHADLVCYIRRATYLLAGDWYHAISGYWSPLISWCIAPLLAVGMDGLHAARAVSCAWGAVLVLCFGWFLNVFVDWPRPYKAAAMAIVAMLSAADSGGQITPDIILAALLFAYFAMVARPDLLTRKMIPLGAGALGGLAYLGKAYAFPFILLHLPIALAIRTWISVRSDRQWLRRGIWAYVIALVGFSLVAGPWAGVISWRYGHPTFSTAGARAHALAGPGRDKRVFAQFATPPDPYLIEWENPEDIPHRFWSPFQSSTHLNYQWRIIDRNARLMLSWLSSAAPPWIAVFGLGLATIALLAAPAVRLVRGTRLSGTSQTLWLIMTILAYCSGFLFVFYADRYISAVVFPLTLILCLHLTLTAFRGKWMRAVPAAIVLGSFAWGAIGMIVETSHTTRSKTPREVSRFILHRLNLPGPIAGNDRIRGYSIALHTGRKFVGFPPDSDLERVEKRLFEAGVRIVIIWKGRTTRGESESFARRAPELVQRPGWRLAYTARDNLTEVYVRTQAEEPGSR